jgi:putative SOS response-associated peptidase YedK
MCGRYTLITDVSKLAEEFEADLDAGLELKPRYNIAPSQMIPVVTGEDGHRRLTVMHWGLVPFWAKEKSIGYKMINARSETVAEKPSFKQAFLKRRCLILADGFYEWKKEGTVKTPMWIHLKSGEPFAFAGLWETWQPPEKKGELLHSTTIITTEANEFMKPIHDRMPVILPKQVASTWLDEKIKDPAALEKLLIPLPSEKLTAHPVSKLVNSPANDRPECVESVSG